MSSNRFPALFAAVDARDVDAFCAQLTPDCSFRYGSRQPVHGLDAVSETISAFFAAFAGLAHRIDEVTEDGDRSAIEGTVTYTGHDGRELTLPFCNVLRSAPDGRIRDYRIYIDPSTMAGGS